ncbi:unnamed protein product, partial [marine sediment metagenome]
DTYVHKFTVRIGQVSAEAFIQSFMPSFGQKPIEESTIQTDKSDHPLPEGQRRWVRQQPHPPTH